MEKKTLLTDEELDEITGGTVQETKEFLNAFLDYGQRSGKMSTEQVNGIKSLSLEEQVNIVEHGISEGGGLADLRLDKKNNSYCFGGTWYSQKEIIRILNNN